MPGALHHEHTERHVTQRNDAAAEQAKDLEVIAALAQETQRPLDEVKKVYEGELASKKKLRRVNGNATATAPRPIPASAPTNGRATIS